MTLRFCALASGSRGNALLVEHNSSLVLIDCGLPLKVLRERLAVIDRKLEDIDALLITHEHGDHSRGVGPFTRRARAAIYATPGTGQSVRALDRFQRISTQRPLEIGSINVQPFPVPHDAREPCQFVFEAGGKRLGVLTDTGHVTPIIRSSLAGLDALAIEFNHCGDMLENGPYPEAVKARVGSRLGHLNNRQATELVAEIAHPDLRWVVGLHLSENNNSPERVRQAAASVAGLAGVELHLAVQDEPTPWMEIN